MPGISKRNTSGFAIVLRICSPIHNLPLRPPPPPPSHLSSSDTAASSFPPIFFVDPIASLYETRIAIDPSANNENRVMVEDVVHADYCSNSEDFDKIIIFVN